MEPKGGSRQDDQAMWKMYEVARNEILTKQQNIQSVVNWMLALFVAGVAAMLLANGQLAVTWRICVLEWLVLVCIALVGLLQYVSETAYALRAAAYCFMLERLLVSPNDARWQPWEHWVMDTEGAMAIPAWASVLPAGVMVALAQGVPFFFVQSSNRPSWWWTFWVAGVLVTAAWPAAIGLASQRASNKLKDAAAGNTAHVEQGHPAYGSGSGSPETSASAAADAPDVAAD